MIDVDGVRASFGDGWGLVRASNTQPVLVLRYEARTPERLAAIASGFASLARGARAQLGATEVRQSVVEMDSVFFFVLSAGRGAQLALVADSSCDMGQTAFEVNRLVRQVGPYLSALPRGRGGEG